MLILFLIYYKYMSSSIHNLRAKISYYKGLLKANGRLTDKQQLKYNEAVEQLNEYNKLNKRTEEEEIEHRKLMIERNRERTRIRNSNIMKYQFGDLKFKNIKDAKNYFQLWLNQHGEDNNVDLVELVELVKNHPIGFNEEKQHIEIRCNPTFSNYCNLVVVDNSTGSVRHLGLYGCITGKSKPKRAKLNDCCRRLIIEQINEFKETNLTPKLCSVCGKQLTSNDVEVDHVIPFSVLVDEFIKQKSLDIDTIEYEQVKGVRMFKDAELANEWICYHKEHAKLDWICKECNVKKSNN